MKVIYVGGPHCDFCAGVMEHSPSEDFEDTHLDKGRCYTVIEQIKYDAPWGKGVGYRLAEIRIREHWVHCSCGFRPIDGDAEEWRRMIRKHRPKTETRELEPV